MLIILWGTIFKHKLIVHFHCGTYADFVEKLSPTLKRMNIWCYKKVDNIVILSNKTKKSFELTKNISSKISVIPYGIKINENITNLKEKFLTKSDPIKIIYLSNLIESKGYFDVLKAVDILVNIKKINICCSFYGLFMNSPDDSNGKSIEDYKSLFFGFIKNKNLQNHVFYKGVIHNELKYLTIVNSHFFVLPSNYSTEGLPVSIIEAMAYKSLVISTDHNAITDLIIPDITGYLVPFSKPEEIANKIEFCTKHPYKYDEIISNAYKHVSENFREQKYCEQLLALFH